MIPGISKTVSALTARVLLAGLVGLLAAGAFPVVSHAGLIVSPGAQTAVEGNSSNFFPFASQLRYQQVFRASDFSLQGPGFITQIAFRPDATFGSAFSTTIPDIQINLSTTGAAPDALSASFANNLGADNTVVFARGPLTLSSAFTGPGSGPMDFDVMINFPIPFFYNPAAGNLLLDVMNFAPAGTSFLLDAHDTAGDSTSRIFAVNVASPTRDIVDSNGLVTRFNVTPVPEPGSSLTGIMIIFTVAASRFSPKAEKKRGCD